jgi:HK97 family phage major capsid protein
MASDYLKNLQGIRLSAWEANKAILDTAGKEGREFTAEEQAAWDKANADIDGYDEQIRSMLEIDRREAEAAEARTAYESILGSKELDRRDDKQVDDVTRFLRGELKSLELDFRGVAREKRNLRSGMEHRDLQEDVAASGGYTVPTNFMRQLWDYLEWYSGARQLNVTVFTTAGGEALQIPNVLTHSTAALKGEGTALAEVDPQFGQVTLNAWKYGVLSQVSSEMLADTGIDILGWLAEDCARAIARVTDVDYVTGSGSSKPKGIVSTQTVGATAQTAATGVPSYANLIDLIYSVNPVARSQGAQWFTRDTNVAKIRKILDTTGRPIWEPSLQVGEPEVLLGYPVVQDPNVTAFGTAAGTHVMFGNFRTFAIRDVGTLRFERSDDFAFSTDLVTFRTVLRTDSDWIGGANGEARGLLAPTT